MRKFILLIVLSIAFSATSQNIKPYILGASANGSIPEAKTTLKAALEESNFKIVGEYMPAKDANRWLIVVSHPALDKAVKTVGGLTGFASVLRVAITKENGTLNVSYTNPAYWGNAYFRDDYPKVETFYKLIDSDFTSAMSKFGQSKKVPFGSEKGESTENLKEYHYMFGMPYFDETIELGQFSSNEAAVSKIDNSLKTGKPGLKLVYKYQVPETGLVLYGIGLDGMNGEELFMPIIDIDNPKHTAFLPYEILVMNGEVHMLHGRYRIALSFPDLTMGTFTKIMSTPGDIENAFIQLVQ